MPSDSGVRKMRRSFVRTPLACYTCRIRKTKCDGAHPRCGFCVRRDLQCSWDAPAPVSDEQSPAPETRHSSGRPQSSYQQSTSPSAAVQTLTSPASISTEAQRWRGLGLCLKLFFERHFLADFCSFAYKPEFENECWHHPALFAAVIALCGRYLEPGDAQIHLGLQTPRKVSEEYTRKARELCKANSDRPSVSNIQANLILAKAELLSNSGSRHWLFAGSAIRMAEIMRLNKDFHQKHSHREQEIRRRTYWACLLLDRVLAYLLGKHRTIDIDTVTIALPDADHALVYQEASRGVTLSTLAEQQRPSDLGILPYLIKTLCMWSEMADIANYSWRRSDPYPPTDPRSKFFIRQEALEAWRSSLPLSLFWDMANYKSQKDLGQERGLVACHLLLQSAFCVAHQCYLPQATTYAQVVDVVDAAGLSYLHQDIEIITKCVSAALDTGSLVEVLVEHGESSSLQSIWAVSAMLIIANTLLWLQYAENIAIQSDGTREKAKRYFGLIRDLMTSWSSSWQAAPRWLRALDIMHDLYKAAYLGEISSHILDSAVDPASHGNGDAPAASSEDGDFHPQPGDGYPSLVSLPNLQASLKFATGDSSANSISVHSVWLQLSSGWPLGISQVDAMLYFDGCFDNMVNV